MSLFSGIGDFFSGITDGISDWLNSDSNPLSGLLGTRNGGLGESLSNPSSWWDKFKNGETNITNEAIAMKNLEYQKERNEIEDKRYEEETAYNRAFQEDERDYQRAFAEDERSYNRALQQQLFNREDTAIERQASQLSAMGINPVSQQLNGLGAGQAVTSSAPASVGAPSASSRGGSALHNDFQMQDMGVMQALAPLASLANTINQVATGQGQRDLLRAQADKQQLDNFILARQFGLQPEFMNGYKNYLKYDNSGNMWFNMNGINQFNKNRLENQSWSINDIDRQDKKREFEFKKSSGYYSSAPDIANKFNYFMSDSFFDTAEKALTKGSELFDKAFNKETNNKKLGFNPFESFMKLFF